MKDLYLYQPHKNQIKIHENKARYKVIVAGRRFGKSALALNEAIARAIQLKNQIIWIVLPLYRQAKEVYWVDPDITRYFTPYIQLGIAKADKSELSLHFKETNSWIRLKGSDNYDSLRGSGIDLIIWDEVADVKPEAFDTIEPALADSPNHKMIYIGTPKGLNWFHDFALKGDHEGIIPDFGKERHINKDWQTWHFTSYDNATWEEGSLERKSFVTYIDEKKKEAEEKGKLAWFNQEYMATFEESAGQFFPEFNYLKHIIPYHLPFKSNVIIGGMDWGRVAPFVVLFSEVQKVNWEGKNFLRTTTFLEVSGIEKTPREWANEIKDRLNNFNLVLDDISWIRGDPAMFTKGQDNSISIADQFKVEGIKIKPASNDRIGGWENLHNWLSIAPDGLPYWQITKNCKGLTSTLPQLVSDENKIEDVDTNGPDHWADSARYFFKHLKWIDAKVGGVIHKGGEKIQLKTAEFIGNKQVGINLDDFIDPNTPKNEKGIGAIIHS